jgi:hypothetical protein
VENDFDQLSKRITQQIRNHMSPLIRGLIDEKTYGWKIRDIVTLTRLCFVKCSAAEPHHFYGAPAPGKNIDAAPATPAPIPYYCTVQYTV